MISYIKINDDGEVKYMTIDEKIEILESREYFVVKGNELIQKSRYDLSLPELKTVSYICSMIKPATPETRSKYYPDNPWQLDYEFNIRDYCKICGIVLDSGKNYADVKAVLKKLSDRSMWLDTGNEEILVRWLSKAKINKKSGKVKIEIDRDLAPYLFDLKEKFTQYQLFNILAMKSAFSVRIYELMKSYAFQKFKIFELDELKRLLMVEKVKSYERFPSFRQKVLEKAQEEINELTDINISFETITKGRKVVKIMFLIEEKSENKKAMASMEINKRLGEL